MLVKFEDDIRNRDEEIHRLEEFIHVKAKKIKEAEDAKNVCLEQETKLRKRIEDLEHEVVELQRNEKSSCTNCNDASANGNEEMVHTTQEEKRTRCIFNDKGHCKYGRGCLFQHCIEVCQFSQTCSTQSCKKRHPLPCKFDSNCRFGPICSFYHNVEHPEDTKEDSEEKKTENYEEGIDFVEDPADVNEQEKDKTTSDLCEVSSNVLQSRHVMKTHLRKHQNIEVWGMSTI